VGAVGARAVEDDGDGLLVGFAINGALGMEKLVGDISQNGGSARGDAAFGDEDKEFGEELVDVGSGLELGELPDEFGGEIGGVRRGGLWLGVAEAKTGARVHDGKLAAATVVGVVAAAGAFGGAGFGGLIVHFMFLDSWIEVLMPPLPMKNASVARKGVVARKCAMRVQRCARGGAIRSSSRASWVIRMGRAPRILARDTNTTPMAMERVRKR
jgi:hypothetical protein